MKFDYRKVPSSPNPADPWTIVPLIKVRLGYQDKVVQMDALVDSRASVSMFHASAAKALGIDLTSGMRGDFFGVSGHSIEVYFHTVRFQIVGTPDQLELAIGFTESPGVGALLGQADFFQHHKVLFERYNERMEIKPAKQ